MKCRVEFHWDEEAQVWTATSDDIPGLVLESGSLDALIERVRFAAPELIALNGLSGIQFIDFGMYRQEKVPAYG